jgi:hypothetical protein
MAPALLSLRIKRAELAEGTASLTAANDLAIRRTLEAVGVEFIDGNGGGPGVRLREGSTSGEPTSRSRDRVKPLRVVPTRAGHFEKSVPLRAKSRYENRLQRHHIAGDRVIAAKLGSRVDRLTIPDIQF